MPIRFKYILLLVLFISAQLMALNHQSHHGGELHQHHDAVCAFSLHKPNQILSGFALAGSLPSVTPFQHIFNEKRFSVVLTPTAFSLPLSRAPPVVC